MVTVSDLGQGTIDTLQEAAELLCRAPERVGLRPTAPRYITRIRRFADLARAARRVGVRECGRRGSSVLAKDS